MWGDKTKYYLFPFLAGIAVSKLCFSFSNDNVHNFTTFNYVIIAVILPLLLLSLMTYYLYNRQYDNIFYSAVALLFILGYNSHHFYNTNIIEIKSNLIICIKQQCTDMCDGISSKYSYKGSALWGQERHSQCREGPFHKNRYAPFVRAFGTSCRYCIFNDTLCIISVKVP